MVSPNLYQTAGSDFLSDRIKVPAHPQERMKVPCNNPTHFSKKKKFALSSLKCNVSSKIFVSCLFIKLWDQISQPASFHEM